MVQQTTDGFWQAELRSEETMKFIRNVYSHQKWDTLVTSHDCTFLAYRERSEIVGWDSNQESQPCEGGVPRYESEVYVPSRGH